jgi:DNA polymerase-4
MTVPIRSILHLDMDAFFAAIEQLDHPEWRGKPVIVGSPPDRRGVVSTCSYEARVFGVRSAMPSRTAGKLCPQGIFVKPRMHRYAEVSNQLMTLLETFSPDIEPVSVDEAFIDLAGILHLWPSREKLAQTLKARIRTELGLTASVGIARNKFLAKVASDFNKPDGLTLIPDDPEIIRNFLAPLPVGRLWGVGRVTESVLLKVGLKTIGDVQRFEASHLEPIVGKAMAAHLKGLADGLDERNLEPSREEKSISNETTFDVDCTDATVWRQTLLELAEEVASRLRAGGWVARTAQIKVRYADFKTLTRQMTLPEPINTDRALLRCVMDLFGRLNPQQAIRLLGIGVSHLTVPGQRAPSDPLLFPEFAPPPTTHRRDGALDRAVDRIRNRFGRESLKRGVWTAGE